MLDGELMHVTDVVAVTEQPVIWAQVVVVLQETAAVCAIVGVGQMVVIAQEFTTLAAQLEDGPVDVGCLGGSEGKVGFPSNPILRTSSTSGRLLDISKVKYLRYGGPCYAESWRRRSRRIYSGYCGCGQPNVMFVSLMCEDGQDGVRKGTDVRNQKE